MFYKLLQDLPSKIFFLQAAYSKKEENQYQQATYEEEQFPTFCYPSAALEFQETNSDMPNVTTRSAPNEYFENGPQGT